MPDIATAVPPSAGASSAGTAPTVRLRLLGGFELEIDGRVVEAQPAVRRLTALVALTPRGLSRDFAAFQLWPDKAEPRAKANLRSTIWRLHSLGAALVLASSTTLRLDPGVWLDVRDGLDASDDLGVSRPFGTLLLDLLPDWYDDWLVIERERFRQLQLASLERRGREVLADDPGRAIQLGLAALAIDAARESSHRLVVEAHLAEGNVWEARREQSRYTRCLASTAV